MPRVERAVGPGQERPDSEGAREASRRRRQRGWAPAWSGGWRLTGVPEGPPDSPAPRLGLGAAEPRLREAAGPEQAPGPAPALRGFQAVSSTRGGVLRARRPDAASRMVSFVT